MAAMTSDENHQKNVLAGHAQRVENRSFSHQIFKSSSWRRVVKLLCVSAFLQAFPFFPLFQVLLLSIPLSQDLFFIYSRKSNIVGISFSFYFRFLQRP